MRVLRDFGPKFKRLGRPFTILWYLFTVKLTHLWAIANEMFLGKA